MLETESLNVRNFLTSQSIGFCTNWHCRALTQKETVSDFHKHKSWKQQLDYIRHKHHFFKVPKSTNLPMTFATQIINWANGRLLWLNLICPPFHSFYLYSTSSSPLLLRGAPDTSWTLCQSFTQKRHRQLRVKDLLKVPTWWLGRDSNPQPFGQKATNLPMRHHTPLCDCILYTPFCHESRPVYSRSKPIHD